MILPRQVDWTSYVRETMAYDINRDQYIRRLDVSYGDMQLHVDALASVQEFRSGRENATRSMMLGILEDRLRFDGIRPSQLRQLALPNGVYSTTGTPLLKRGSFYDTQCLSL